ncbi:MAG: hypothetical protein JW750_07780 [Anaerolineaceae bacterium]|nr:hypothetical protein [Anaerolineaceae bacterium]
MHDGNPHTLLDQSPRCRGGEDRMRVEQNDRSARGKRAEELIGLREGLEDRLVASDA